MILSLLAILSAMYWLMLESNFLRCNLMGEVSEPIQNIERSKHSPRIELGRIKTCSYPVTKLLAEMCELTQFQQDKEQMRYGRYRRYSYNGVDPINRDSYQQMIIGGHMVILNATSPKLYDTIAEVQKTADSKPRKISWTSPKLPLDAFVETVRTGSHNEYIPRKIWHEDGTVTDDPKHGFNQIVSEYKTYFHDSLVPKEWLEAHYNDHKDFEPTIELMVNEKSISFNGDFRTGKIHDFCVLNAEVWERPQIKGKKIKVEAN